MRRAALALLAAAVLGGCATPAPGPDESPGALRWTSGRLSLRVDASAGQGAQSLSAGFELRGNDAEGELRLNSPLGTRLASARWQPGLALLTTPEGEQAFDSLDALATRALGEPLPLGALPDWIAGRPWGAAPHLLNDSGFEQLGWQVVLTRRGQGQIDARRAMPPVVRLSLRLDAVR